MAVFLFQKVFELIHTMKDILLRCKLNFSDVAAVLITAVSSVFSAATAVKTAVLAEILTRQQ